jgi:hypothetical protein
MGLKIKQNGVFVDVGGGGTTTQFVDDWVRNPAWPAIPTVLASEQKIVGLYAVWRGDGTGNGANFFAFNGQGAYTINYGDGTTTNYASNTQANYEFNFNNAALVGTDRPVTFTASTNTVNLAAHGFATGTAIPFFNIVSTTGLIQGRRYYVVNPAANTFQVSDTIGGSPVTLINDGSATLLPYKVAIVTITPQAGQNLTVINLQAKNTQTGLQAYTTGWLDLAISVPNVTGTSFTLGGLTVGHRSLERVNVIACGALTSMANMYSGLVSLESVAPFPSPISAVTTMAGKYQNCSMVKRFPPYIGSAGALTNTSNKYTNCFSGTSFPPLPVSNAALTTANQMYFGCQSCEIFPEFVSTAQMTNVNQMYAGCNSMQTTPVHNMSGVTSQTNAAAFINGPNVSRAQISGMRFNISLINMKLSAVALNEIFTGLPTVTGQTITVTGNYGTSQTGVYNPSIATAKGWTVTS